MIVVTGNLKLIVQRNMDCQSLSQIMINFCVMFVRIYFLKDPIFMDVENVTLTVAKTATMVKQSKKKKKIVRKRKKL